MADSFFIMVLDNILNIISNSQHSLYTFQSTTTDYNYTGTHCDIIFSVFPIRQSRARNLLFLDIRERRVTSRARKRLAHF